jgi:hypothetical protein
LSTPDVTTKSSGAPEPNGDAYLWGKKRIDRAMKTHGARCERYKRREDAWLAARKRAGDEPKVRFAYERMDVLMSYITAERPVGKVAPLKPGDKCEAAAKLMDKAFGYWRRKDQRDSKQFTWMLTALVYGVSPAKSVWAYDRTEETYRSPVNDPVTGEPTGFETKTRNITVTDQPSMVLVNPYDFAWDPAAVTLEDADFVCYWAYPTLAELKQGEKEGRYYNTKMVNEITPQSQRVSTTNSSRNRDLTGRVEVVEVWSKDRLVVIANGVTCIRDEPNPFQHHELPFIVGTTMPNLTGSIETSSEVELIADIQKELWDIRKQFVISMRLANKCIVLLDGEMGDPEPVLNALRGDNQFVGIAYESQTGSPPLPWSPTTNLLTAGVQGMEAYKKDMDDMSGVGPYVSGDSEKTLDPKTATEISTLQSASMRRINKTRNMLNQSLERLSNLELKLTMQFLVRPLAVRIDEGDAWSWEYVDPQQVIDADLEYVIRDADENMDQEQKRAEANARMQTTIAVATAAAALGQGAPNVKKAFEDYIEAYGEDDPNEWWIDPQPQMPIAPPLGPNGVAPPGAGLNGGAPPLGPPTPLGPGPAAPTPAGVNGGY